MFAVDHALTQSRLGGAKDRATVLGSHAPLKPTLSESKWRRFENTGPESPFGTPYTPLSQVSTAPGTPSSSFLDDFSLDSPWMTPSTPSNSFQGIRRRSLDMFRLDEQEEIQEEPCKEISEPAEGDVNKIIEFLSVFEERPSCEESAEGDVIKLIEFLAVFQEEISELAEGDVNKIIEFLSVFEAEISEPAEGDVDMIIEFLSVFEERPSCEESAEGDVSKLIEFLAAFQEEISELAEGDVNKIIEFLSVFKERPSCKEFEEPAEGDVNKIIEFLGVFEGHAEPVLPKQLAEESKHNTSWLQLIKTIEAEESKHNTSCCLCRLDANSSQQNC